MLGTSIALKEFCMDGDRFILFIQSLLFLGYLVILTDAATMSRKQKRRVDTPWGVPMDWH
jgi:hypothetical protein